MVRREGLEGRAVAITTMVSLSILSFSTTRWISSWGLDIVHGIPLLLILVGRADSTRGRGRTVYGAKPMDYDDPFVKILI